jgi:hypothetical protein
LLIAPPPPHRAVLPLYSPRISHGVAEGGAGNALPQCPPKVCQRGKVTRLGDGEPT